MDKAKVIRILESTLDYNNNRILKIQNEESKKELNFKINYIESLVKFIITEKYENYTESIEEFHKQVLEEYKKEIDLSYEESHIKSLYEMYKDMLSRNSKLAGRDLTYYIQKVDEYGLLLKNVQECNERYIEEEKEKKFKEYKLKYDYFKIEIISILESKNKESNEIENEDLKKATDLILNCIKKAKEEILTEIKNNKK